jgi:hypothetical protein
MAPGSARKKTFGQSKADPGLVSPRKTPAKPKPGAHLVGKKIVCPGEVFSTPEKSYPGIVTRTGNIKGTPRLWVQFDEDKSNYWFPTTDVEAWVSESAAQVGFCATPSMFGWGMIVTKVYGEDVLQSRQHCSWNSRAYLVASLWQTKAFNQAVKFDNQP